MHPKGVTDVRGRLSNRSVRDHPRGLECGVSDLHRVVNSQVQDDLEAVSFGHGPVAHVVT